MAAEIRIFPCLNDNYGYLIHDPVEAVWLGGTGILAGARLDRQECRCHQIQKRTESAEPCLGPFRQGHARFKDDHAVATYPANERHTFAHSPHVWRSRSYSVWCPTQNQTSPSARAFASAR